MPSKPKPFKRPSISLSSGAGKEARVWKIIPVSSLLPEDLLLGLGKVVQVSDSPRGYRISLLSGKILDYEEGEQVDAFVKVRK